MFKLLALSISLMFFIGCGEDSTTTAATTTTSGSDGSDGGTTVTGATNVTLNYTGVTGTYQCGNNSDLIDTMTISLTNCDIKISNCLIGDMQWSGDSSTITIEANTTIQSFSYTATTSTLKARQDILDLVDSVDLTELIY